MSQAEAVANAQAALANSAAAAEAMTQSGGQVQPVGTEGAMNGFTAVNGRISSPPHPNRQVSVDATHDQSSLPPREFGVRHTVESDQLHPLDRAAGNHMSTPQPNGVHKRKRSVGDLEEDHSSPESDRSSGSPPTASPDAHMQDGANFGHPHRPGPEHQDGSWQGHPHDEQAEHLRMLAPIQHDNQQHSNGNYASAPHMQNGNGMRPGYHKDESTGLITTNAGVQMDPKKRKRVSRSFTVRIEREY